MRNPKVHEIIQQLEKLHDTKNADYATTEDPLSNFRECERLHCPYCHKPIPAWIGVLIRLSDKYTRTNNLTRKDPSVKGESIVDTFNDRVVYNIIARILYEEWLEKQKQAKSPSLADMLMLKREERKEEEETG